MQRSRFFAHFLVLTSVSFAALLSATPAGGETAAKNFGTVKPVDSWRVGTVGAGDTAYCAMVNKYEQGTVLAVARDPAGFGTLAFNFADPLFETGKSYQTGVKVNGTQMTYEGVASAPNALVVQGRQDDPLFKALEKNGTLDVDASVVKIGFALDKFSRTAPDLAECAASLGGAAAVAATSGGAEKADETASVADSLNALEQEEPVQAAQKQTPQKTESKKEPAKQPVKEAAQEAPVAPSKPERTLLAGAGEVASAPVDASAHLSSGTMAQHMEERQMAVLSLQKEAAAKAASQPAPVKQTAKQAAKKAAPAKTVTPELPAADEAVVDVTEAVTATAAAPVTAARDIAEVKAVPPVMPRETISPRKRAIEERKKAEITAEARAAVERQRLEALENLRAAQVTSAAEFARQEEIFAQQKRLGDLTHEAAALSQQAAQLSSDREHLQKQLDEALKFNAMTTPEMKKLLALEADLKQSEAARLAAESNLKSLGQEKARSSEELARMQKQLDDKTAETHKLAAEVMAQAAAAQAAVQAAQMAKQSAESETIARLKKEMAEKDAALAALQQKLSAGNRHYETLKKDIEEKQSTMAALTVADHAATKLAVVSSAPVSRALSVPADTSLPVPQDAAGTKTGAVLSGLSVPPDYYEGIVSGIEKRAGGEVAAPAVSVPADTGTPSRKLLATTGNAPVADIRWDETPLGEPAARKTVTEKPVSLMPSPAIATETAIATATQTPVAAASATAEKTSVSATDLALPPAALLAVSEPPVVSTPTVSAASASPVAAALAATAVATAMSQPVTAQSSVEKQVVEQPSAPVAEKPADTSFDRLFAAVPPVGQDVAPSRGDTTRPALAVDAVVSAPPPVSTHHSPDPVVSTTQLRDVQPLTAAQIRMEEDLKRLEAERQAEAARLERVRADLAAAQAQIERLRHEQQSAPAAQTSAAAVERAMSVATTAATERAAPQPAIEWNTPVPQQSATSPAPVAAPVAAPATAPAYNNRAAAFLERVMQHHRGEGHAAPLLPSERPSQSATPAAAPATDAGTILRDVTAAAVPALAAPVQQAPSAAVPSYATSGVSVPPPATARPQIAAPVAASATGGRVTLERLIAATGLRGATAVTVAAEPGVEIRQWSAGRIDGMVEKISGSGNFSARVENYIDRYRADCPGHLDVGGGDVRQTASGAYADVTLSCNLPNNNYQSVLSFVQEPAAMTVVLHTGYPTDAALIKSIGDNVSYVLSSAASVDLGGGAPVSAPVSVPPVSVPVSAPVSVPPAYQRPSYQPPPVTQYDAAPAFMPASRIADSAPRASDNVPPATGAPLRFRITDVPAPTVGGYPGDEFGTVVIE